MPDYLKPVIKEMAAAHTYDEYNLLSVAFKNLIGEKRPIIKNIIAG